MHQLDATIRANKNRRIVFVWAPAGRCGTGLLQRLITSSKDVLVYGEDYLVAQSMPNHILALSQLGQESQTATERLATGDYTNWSPNAMPDGQAYLSTVLGSIYAIADVYRKTAAKHGFRRWGTKLPEANGNTIRILQQIFPESQHVFVYRDITDVLRSYKGRRWIKGSVDVVQLARTWAHAIAEVLGDADELGILPIKYELLVADPAGETERLAEFLGTRPMDLDVFKHKVNTWAADDKDRGLSATQYIEPEEPTAEELKILAGIPPSVLELTGYPVPA